MGPKSIQKRGRNFGAKKLPLGSDFGGFWLVLGGAGEAFLLMFYLLLYVFQEIDVCEAQGVQEGSGSQKGFKMEPKCLPSRPPNRSKIDVPNRTFFRCEKGGFGRANRVGVGDTFGTHGNPFRKLGYRF